MYAITFRGGRRIPRRRAWPTMMLSPTVPGNHASSLNATTQKSYPPLPKPARLGSQQPDLIAARRRSVPADMGCPNTCAAHPLPAQPPAPPAAVPYPARHVFHRRQAKHPAASASCRHPFTSRRNPSKMLLRMLVSISSGFCATNATCCATPRMSYSSTARPARLSRPPAASAAAARWMHRRGFPAARRAAERHMLSRIDRQVHAIENRRPGHQHAHAVVRHVERLRATAVPASAREQHQWLVQVLRDPAQILLRQYAR